MNRDKAMLATMIALAASFIPMSEPKPEQLEQERQHRLTKAEKKRAVRAARNVAIQTKEAQL